VVSLLAFGFDSDACALFQVPFNLTFLPNEVLILMGDFFADPDEIAMTLQELINDQFVGDPTLPELTDGDIIPNKTFIGSKYGTVISSTCLMLSTQHNLFFAAKIASPI